jgi:hypothetical protein
LDQLKSGLGFEICSFNPSQMHKKMDRSESGFGLEKFDFYEYNTTTS